MPPRRAAPTLSGPPDEAALYDAAMAHVARYATTQAGLARVLNRRVDRWARAAGEASDDPEGLAAAVAGARLAVRAVVARLVALGAVNDAAFAASRARSLGRAGRSRVAVAAHLAAHGVAKETAQAALPDDPAAELGAAVLLARRRRIGPFRRSEADSEIRRRELGMLARAGFPQPVAEAALDMPPDEAEALVLRLRWT
ncbi:MAG TPA: RecX family transcriptional regulator [Acetobacteraceae bacterium]|nr:RecX family transcriptional regulator [Acetobacteraceae bacterium]